MESVEEQGVWAVLERAVKGRDAKAFTACVEMAGGFVGADLGLLVVEPVERRWLDTLLGPGSGLFGDAEAERLLAALRPLQGPVAFDDTARVPLLASLTGASSMRALVATPLFGVDGQRLGELVLARHEPRAFTGEDRALIAAAAFFFQRHLEVVLLSIRCAVASRLPGRDRAARAVDGTTGRSATDLLVHDLKNPLTVIVLTAESARASGDPQVPGLMDDIIESASIAQRLVNDMLDVRAGGGLPMARDPVDLRALAQRLIERTSVVAAQRQQTLVLQCSVEAPIVEGDAFLLERLLRNLLDNAFKYAPASSNITVVIAEGEGGYVLRVEDEGHPIAPALRAAIFEQDTRLMSSGRGSHGLGLKLCRVVAELHQSRLTVEDTSAGGNAFSLELRRGGAVTAGPRPPAG